MIREWRWDTGDLRDAASRTNRRVPYDRHPADIVGPAGAFTLNRTFSFAVRRHEWPIYGHAALESILTFISVGCCFAPR